MAMNCPKCEIECEGEDMNEPVLFYECGECGTSWDSSEELYQKADMIRKAMKENWG